ncbi:MAG: phosphate signaling complex protein PhoU [Proteobacteria bacterium]|nr:phosphate signaling complex protein PhoU [Pseudomonadota bacterium]MBI3497389.1 phosphate signaling complex protein PhoU [Pseudomonadota bacterium]
MAAEHIIKAYDEDLKRLKTFISEMGGLVEAHLEQAVQAVVKRDTDLAQRCIAADAKVDALEHDIEAFVVRLLALRQPMAGDLRGIVAALKISSELERIGDYAANVAKRSIALKNLPVVQPASGIPRMSRMVQSNLKDVLDAYIDGDTAKAVAVWKRDEEVDEMYTSLFRELLTYMMEDPRNITACTHLLFMAKNIERMGDHATNIAETVHFQVVGTTIKGERPKGDTSSFTVVTPPGSGDAAETR